MTDRNPPQPTTAFVLAGGGSLGAVQVGMLQALGVHGIEPDLLVGTSAGAMNAVWVSAHGMSPDSLEQLAEIWGRLKRREVFPLDVRTALRGVLGLSPAVIPDHRLRRLIASSAGIDTFEEASIPVHLVAGDLVTGQPVIISTGPVVEGVLASAALPGIFTPVLRDGRHLIDGGVADHTGVTAAISLGARRIYILPTGTPCALVSPPTSAIGTALHALTMVIQQRLAHEIADHGGDASIKVLPPLCPLNVSAADFTHAAELIARSRAAADEWIASGDIDLPQPERFLAAHRHTQPSGIRKGSYAAELGPRPTLSGRSTTPTG